MTKRYGYEDERRRGGYGLGGADRGYNQGGYGGRGSFEEGYRRGSYDRLVDMGERRRGTEDEEYGRFPEEEERSWYERSKRHGDWAIGLGREAWGDERSTFWLAIHRRQRGDAWGDSVLRAEFADKPGYRFYQVAARETLGVRGWVRSVAAPGPERGDLRERELLPSG